MSDYEDDGEGDFDGLEEDPVDADDLDDDAPGAPGAPPGGAPVPAADADADDDDDLDRGVDASGVASSDDDTDAGTDVATDTEDNSGPAEPAGGKARPDRVKVDPLLRMSNKPRTVRLVAPDERRTSNWLQRPEAAYIIAMRARQIADGSTCFVDGDGLHDPVALAFKELLARRTPFALRRVVGSGPGGELIVEEWPVREMAIPPLVPPVSLGSVQ